MWIEDLLWDDRSIEHIARHRVEQYEVEEAISGRVWFKRAGKQRYLAHGQTDAGRYLFVVLDREFDDLFYVVTARDMSTSERRLYRKAIGGR